MKEKPIIFNSEMVQAILEGRKTQTRRVISNKNSEVGEGRVDWRKFCWDGSEIHDFGDSRYSTESEYVPDELKGQLIGVKKAPLPFMDGNLEKCHYQYLHVAYRWQDDATVFRIYPKWDVGDRLWVRETWATDKIFDKMNCKQIEDTGIATVPLWYKVLDIQVDNPTTTLGRWRSGRFMPRWASRIILKINEIRVERLQTITLADIYDEGVDIVPAYDRLDAFKKLWDSINAKRGYSWQSNPFVWVISFNRL